MTAGPENSVDLGEAVARLAEPFFAQGGEVWVARCCDFLYAGALAPMSCGTCKRPVTGVRVRTLSDAQKWVAG